MVVHTVLVAVPVGATLNVFVHLRGAEIEIVKITRVAEYALSLLLGINLVM